jgi:hypothetical protein
MGGPSPLPGLRDVNGEEEEEEEEEEDHDPSSIPPEAPAM